MGSCVYVGVAVGMALSSVFLGSKMKGGRLFGRPPWVRLLCRRLYAASFFSSFFLKVCGSTEVATSTKFVTSFPSLVV